jgi:hypothetical protein
LSCIGGIIWQTVKVRECICQTFNFPKLGYIHTFSYMYRFYMEQIVEKIYNMCKGAVEREGGIK